MCSQHLPPAGLNDVPVVAPAPDFQVRRQQYEKLQLGEEIRVSVQAGMDQNTILMGIGNHFFDDAKATLWIRIGYSVAQRVRG
jgi:hypothetical protein